MGEWLEGSGRGGGSLFQPVLGRLLLDRVDVTTKLLQQTKERACIRVAIEIIHEETAQKKQSARHYRKIHRKKMASEYICFSTEC